MRSNRFEVQVNGRPVEVEAGTSVAAALFNARQWHLRTSVRGEPRGPICAMGICFECRVTLDGSKHRRACMELCRPGMEIVTGE